MIVANDRTINRLKSLSINLQRCGVSNTVVSLMEGRFFKDQQFDKIVLSNVLEHIKDDSKALKELYRVLKPGGWAIIQVPIWAVSTFENSTIPREQYLAKYGHSDHVRRYGLDFFDLLKKNNFDVTIDNFVEEFSKEEIKKYGLFPTEHIYLCRKL